MIEVTYAYTRPMVRDAAWRFLWHRHRFVLAILLLALVLSVWMATYANLRWLSGLLAGLVLAWSRSLVLAWRGTIRDAQAFVSTPLTLRLGDAGLEFDCELVRSFSPWRAFPLVVSTPAYLFLTRAGSAQPFVVPVASVGAETATFLVERVREAGGRVESY